MGEIDVVERGAADFAPVSVHRRFELCLVLRDREPAKFERATTALVRPLCREIPGVRLQEGQTVLALLAAIRRPNGKRAASALAELFEQRGPSETVHIVALRTITSCSTA
jgi:hypothetical protein